MSDSSIDRAAFNTLSYGLYIVTALDKEGHRCGCVINTLLQVTSQPPQLLIAINKENATTKAIEESGVFCASVLAQSATMDLIGTFGFKSSYEIEKFEGIEVGNSAQGIPYLLDHAVAYFELKVEHRIDVGTHILYISSVAEAKKLSDDQPLTYEYYHDVIKGKTPPKASSYNPADSSVSRDAKDVDEIANGEQQPNVGWKCTLCGKVIEGYPEGLPEDFRCPICGVGREFFQKIEL